MSAKKKSSEGPKTGGVDASGKKGIEERAQRRKDRAKAIELRDEADRLDG